MGEGSEGGREGGKEELLKPPYRRVPASCPSCPSFRSRLSVPHAPPRPPHPHPPHSPHEGAGLTKMVSKLSKEGAWRKALELFEAVEEMG